MVRGGGDEAKSDKTAILKRQHFYPSAIKENDKCKLNSCQPCASQANQPL